MTLSLNREFALKHLFAALVFLGLSLYFGYDGLVRYPQAEPAALYAAIEGREAPEGLDLAAFKRQKVRVQRSFSVLLLLSALAVGGHLLAVARFRLAFDDEGYEFRGVRTRYAELKAVDWSQWQKQGVLRVNGLRLDAWHHTGVRELAERVRAACPPPEDEA